MPKTPSMLTPDDIVRARDLYAGGMPNRDICRETDVTLHGLYFCLAGGPLQGDGRLFENMPRKKSGAAAKWKTNSPERATLVRRLWQTAEAQVRHLESRMSLDGIEPAERERDARTMAVLVKTLRDLNEFDGGDSRKNLTRSGQAQPAAPEKNYDDPRAIDDFRRELARRIAALAAAASADAGNGT